jgi:hypothetical protein
MRHCSAAFRCSWKRTIELEGVASRAAALRRCCLLMFLIFGLCFLSSPPFSPPLPVRPSLSLSSPSLSLPPFPLPSPPILFSFVIQRIGSRTSLQTSSMNQPSLGVGAWRVWHVALKQTASDSPTPVCGDKEGKCTSDRDSSNSNSKIKSNSSRPQAIA